MAANKFSLAQAWLLIEDSLINFGPIPCGAFDNNSNTNGWFMRTVLEAIGIK